MRYGGMYKQKETNKKWYLKMEEKNQNIITFYAVDENGENIKHGSFFTFNTNTGKINLFYAISKEFGFDLSENDRIKILT